jgi:hypothetical protein
MTLLHCTINCTIHCTQRSQPSPYTTTLHNDCHPILLKTRGPQHENRPVAPRVAGSNPVAHPNFLYYKKRGLFRIRFVCFFQGLCDVRIFFENFRHRFPPRNLADSHSLSRQLDRNLWDNCQRPLT